MFLNIIYLIKGKQYFKINLIFATSSTYYYYYWAKIWEKQFFLKNFPAKYRSLSIQAFVPFEYWILPWWTIACSLSCRVSNQINQIESWRKHRCCAWVRERVCHHWGLYLRPRAWRSIPMIRAECDTTQLFRHPYHKFNLNRQNSTKTRPTKWNGWLYTMSECVQVPLT